MINVSPKKWLIFFTIQILFCICLFLQWTKLPDGKFHFTAFNVPVGDGLFIETPEGHNIIIDGGVDNSIVAMIYNKKAFFDRSIDALIVTHPDSDHINGSFSILKNFDVKTIFITGVESDYPVYHEFINLAETKNIPIVFIDKNKNLRSKTSEFQVLNPLKNLAGNAVKNLNDSSIVIRAKAFGKSILLTGDAETEAERAMLLSAYKLQSDILKVAHHGSKSSTSLEFLAAVNPNIAVISAGAENNFGHPHKEVIDRLKNQSMEILVTKDMGDVEIVIDEDDLKI